MPATSYRAPVKDSVPGVDQDTDPLVAGIAGILWDHGALTDNNGCAGCGARIVARDGSFGDGLADHQLRVLGLDAPDRVVLEVLAEYRDVWPYAHVAQAVELVGAVLARS